MVKVHPACAQLTFPSLFLHLHIQENTCTKANVIVSLLIRAPSLLSSQPSALSRRFTCSFFLQLFLKRLSSCEDPAPPLLPPPCTNTADRKWRCCYDTVACLSTNPSQSSNQQAVNGIVCVCVLSFFQLF